MTENRGQHVAVLQAEALQALEIKPSGIYLDGTYGRGGHSGLILDSLGQDGRLIAIDQDSEAVADGLHRFAGDKRFSLYKRNFEELAAVAEQCGVLGQVDGVLLDIGVSSPQVDTAERGFSFSRDGELDMRMDTENGESAASWLQQVAQADLATVLRDYGEERYANRIAAAIVKARTEKPVTSTSVLAEIVKAAHPRWDHQRHPATKTFQAIRIHVNRELDVLRSALTQSVDILKPHGRLVVISFHSLEDRIVKRFMRGENKVQTVPRHLPLPDTPKNPLKILGRKKPTAAELAENPRARSAVLRFAERVH